MSSNSTMRTRFAAVLSSALFTLVGTASAQREETANDRPSAPVVVVASAPAGGGVRLTWRYPPTPDGRPRARRKAGLRKGVRLFAEGSVPETAASSSENFVKAGVQENVEQ